MHSYEPCGQPCWRAQRGNVGEGSEVNFQGGGMMSFWHVAVLCGIWGCVCLTCLWLGLHVASALGPRTSAGAVPRASPPACPLHRWPRRERRRSPARGTGGPNGRCRPGLSPAAGLRVGWGRVGVLGGLDQTIHRLGDNGVLLSWVWGGRVLAVQSDLPNSLGISATSDPARQLPLFERRHPIHMHLRPPSKSPIHGNPHPHCK